MARVVAHDERDLAVAAGVLRVVAHEMGDVDPRDRGARHRPRRRDRPVAAVDQPGRGIRQTRRLRLGQRRATAGCRTRPSAPRRRRNSRVAGCRCGTSVDGVLILNDTVWPTFDAHRRRVPLDRRVADPFDLPVARRIARQLVLTRHRIGASGSTPQWNSGPPRDDEHDHRSRDGRQRPAASPGDTRLLWRSHLHRPDAPERVAGRSADTQLAGSAVRGAGTARPPCSDAR